jgi:hypothetical protein
MAVNEVVSGMGAGAKRTDKNVSSRVAKIQREANVQNASGGAYGNRADLTSIASGASTTVSSPMPTGMPTGAVTSAPRSMNAFAPGTGDVNPLSDGSRLGPGRDASAQPIPVNTPNPDSIFVRALAASNPESRQLMMMVEAYNEMEAD